MSEISFDSPDPETRLSRRTTPLPTPAEVTANGALGHGAVPRNDPPPRAAGRGPVRSVRSASAGQLDAPEEPAPASVSRQLDRYYREQNVGYSTDHVGLHWSGGSDPFTRDAASLTMMRNRDRHYPIASPDLNDGNYENVDGQLQGVLMDSDRATDWKIDTLYSTKGSHAAVAQLLGMAGEHALRTTGRLPKASRDLSVHSTRLVKGLADRGIIDAPTNELRNNIDWEYGATSARSAVRYAERDHNAGRESVSEVPVEEAQRGGQMLRQMLRGAKHQPTERWTPETLTESAPLVNARSKAGRFAEFEHHARLQEQADQTARPEPDPHQGRLW